jgi:hypothetical protein
MAKAPMNPIAGVSGPGKYSVRTDNLTMGSTSYGEGVETAAIQSGAPLSKTPNQRPMPANEVRAAATQAPVTGLYDPTSRPNEPVTNGADVGPGLGSDSLMMAKPADDSEFRMNIEGSKSVLAYIADLPNTSPETRAAIKELWNMQ